jgi:hypothetical protein
MAWPTWESPIASQAIFLPLWNLPLSSLQTSRVWLAWHSRFGARFLWPSARHSLFTKLRATSAMQEYTCDHRHRESDLDRELTMLTASAHWSPAESWDWRPTSWRWQKESWLQSCRLMMMMHRWGWSSWRSLGLLFAAWSVWDWAVARPFWSLIWWEVGTCLLA